MDGEGKGDVNFQNLGFVQTFCMLFWRITTFQQTDSLITPTLEVFMRLSESRFYK